MGELARRDACSRRRGRRSCAATDGNPPPILDPFCGGGSIPLEAQRLGLEAHASRPQPGRGADHQGADRDPAEVRRPAAGHPRRSPTARHTGGWAAATGLAETCAATAQWMRDEADSRIGHLYPKASFGWRRGDGDRLALGAHGHLPEPGLCAEMPLVRSFELSTKTGKEAWVEPVTYGAGKSVSFEVKTGKGKGRDGTVGRLGAHCLTCGTAVSLNEIRAQGKAGRMSQNLLAVVADGPSGRVYLSPPNVHAVAARVEPRIDFLDIPLPNNPRDFKTPNYGMRRFCDLFTPRQLVALTTFSDLVGQARERVLAGAIAAGRPDDGIGIADGGTGAQAYSDAVATYSPSPSTACQTTHPPSARGTCPARKCGTHSAGRRFR